jgi:hypothetical protein
MALANARRVAAAARDIPYERHRPELTALYELVRDNLETLYGAIDDGALDVRVPKHAKKELEAYLDCGLLSRGFAHLVCESCGEAESSHGAARVAASAPHAWAVACARPRRT